MFTTVAVCISFFGAARTAIWTTDALLSAFLGFIDVKSSRCNNDDKDCDQNVVNHLDFAPLNAYSRFKSFSDFTHR